MATPITIKKRKISFKSPSAGTESATTDPGDTELDAEDDVMPAHFNTAPIQVIKTSSPAQTIFGIIAVFAAILFVIVIVLQWTEWSEIITSFPRPIQTGELIVPTT